MNLGEIKVDETLGDEGSLKYPSLMHDYWCLDDFEWRQISVYEMHL